MSVRSRSARLAAVAVLALAVAACTKTLDTGGLEDQLKKQIEQQTATTITSVDCPADVEVKTGGHVRVHRRGGVGRLVHDQGHADGRPGQRGLGNRRRQRPEPGREPRGLRGSRVLLEGKRLPDHRRAHAAVDRVRRGAVGPGAGWRDRAHELRAHGEPHREDGQAPARPAGRARARRERAASRSRRSATSWRTAGDGSTASCTRSRSRRRTPSAATSSTRQWESVATAVRTSAFSLKALAAGMLPLMEDAAARSSRSTSTRGSPGRSTTGWASRRRVSSRSPATSRATSGPKGIRVNTVSAGPLRDDGRQGHPGVRGDHRARGGGARRSAGT